MDPLLTYLGPILTLTGVLGAAFFTYRASNRKLKADTGLALLNEHQEEIASLRKELADVRRTQRIQGDYIGQLRRHIADGSPPPPPAWPDGLVT
ncbi:hypothetical protein Q0Z83_060050 [Actinoplanes sichuanensis]|uniref:Uncharacterized protein n=1 Tax=Actinoplanes sichuanensis TaxID=512349 RepID=A0ABW4A631_9ACTN|nr:hypothetical protein [Actinoplanes sichuanensis]BEL07814.1 hypothetical protein Q0Z83_060050 [Actinoplanes sichuanensis]